MTQHGEEKTSGWLRFVASCSLSERELLDQISFIRKNIPNMLEMIHQEGCYTPTAGKQGLYNAIVDEIKSLGVNFQRVIDSSTKAPVIDANPNKPI